MMTGYADAARIQAMIEALDRHTDTPGHGTTRLTWTPTYRAAADHVAADMRAAGLAVREDAVGNLFGRLEGSCPDLPPVLVGSHLDSVRQGGRFDGPAGIVAGIEAARLLGELGLVPRRPIEIVALIEEEGGRFGGGLLGSRLLAGQIGPQDLHGMQDGDGVPAVQAMRDYGLDPDLAGQAALAPGAAHAWLELHIEQGPVLEAEGLDVAIVDRIVGLAQLQVTVRGQAGHAGTVPMDRRRDALAGAVTILAQLPDLARQTGRESVLTVGRLEVLPGAANVIPDRVTFTIDLRAPDHDVVLRLIEMVEGCVAHAQGNGLVCTVERQLFAAPTPMSGQIVQALGASADALGLSHRLMVSGAGHDAMVLAGVMPAGMIFVPSRDGISHAPEEFSTPAWLARGTDLLFATLRRIAEAS